MKELFDKKSLAARWKCSTRKVDMMRKSGELPFVKLGNLVRFREEDVDSIERRCSEIWRDPIPEKAGNGSQGAEAPVTESSTYKTLRAVSR